MKMLYEVFQDFSLASGMVSNNDKSSIQFGGVPHDIQAEILQELGFAQGQMTFNYLGVPLPIKKVAIVQYQLLIEKLMERIHTWTTRFLSYAGKAQ